MGKIFSKDRKDIYDAAEHGDIKSIKYFVEELKVDVNKLNKDGRTALHLAATNGHLKAVRYLVDEGKANLFKQEDTPSKDTAIHSAARANQLDVLKYFLEEKEVDVNLKNGRGQSAALSASANNQLNILKYLVDERHANVTMTDANGDNILFYSAETGNLKIVKYLLDEKNIKFDLNQENNFGMTLVLRAASLNRLNVLQYFIGEKHAEVNTSDITGETPLHLAALNNYVDVVKYLLDHGANTETKNDSGISASEYIRKKMPQVLQSKRNRRSIPQTFLFSSTVRRASPLPCTWITRMLTKDLIRALDGEKSTTQLGSPEIEGFLTLADACVRYATGSNYQQIKHESLLTPSEILESRMDPAAINAIKTISEFDTLDHN